MITLEQILPIILYLLGIVLLVVLIILGIRVIQTLKKVDRIVEDIDRKTNQLNGVFHIIDNTADFVNKISDKAVTAIFEGITKLFHRKKKRKDEEDE